MSTIKLIVFDIAGTTVKDNSNVSTAFLKAMQKFGYGKIKEDEVREIMGYAKPLAIKMLLVKHEEQKDKINEGLISAIHRFFINEMVSFYQHDTCIGPTPNAEETLMVLRKKGYKVGINTGFSRAIANVIVERLGWVEKGVFDYLIASDEVANGRPFPDMIHKMMDIAGITEPKEVVKVGDTEVDINEGKKVGCKYIVGVTTGAFSREQLLAYQPTHIIDNIADVIDIVA